MEHSAQRASAQPLATAYCEGFGTTVDTISDRANESLRGRSFVNPVWEPLSMAGTVPETRLQGGTRR